MMPYSCETRAPEHRNNKEIMVYSRYINYKGANLGIDRDLQIFFYCRGRIDYDIRMWFMSKIMLLYIRDLILRCKIYNTAGLL